MANLYRKEKQVRQVVFFDYREIDNLKLFFLCVTRA